MEIKGIPVRKVLVGPAADIVKEYYLSAVLDRAGRRILLMGSAEGGVEIEQVAAERPGGDRDDPRRSVPGAPGLAGPRDGVPLGLGGAPEGRRRDRQGPRPDDARQRRRPRRDQPARDRARAGADGGAVERLVCLDAKVTLDDSALARHPGLEDLRDPDEEDPADREAREAGLTFIKLDGTIGCMVNGAGLAMTTMDLVKRAGGEPANFLDIGGGARADKVARAMRLILADPKVNAILVNIFGGITRGDEVARGLIEARAPAGRATCRWSSGSSGTNAAEAARAPPRGAVPRPRTRSTRRPPRPSPRRRAAAA